MCEKSTCDKSAATEQRVCGDGDFLLSASFQFNEIINRFPTTDYPRRHFRNKALKILTNRVFNKIHELNIGKRSNKATWATSVMTVADIPNGK